MQTVLVQRARVATLKRGIARDNPTALNLRYPFHLSSRHLHAHIRWHVLTARILCTNDAVRTSIAGALNGIEVAVMMPRILMAHASLQLMRP